MISIAEAMQTFLSRLEITRRTEEDAERQREYLREKLHGALSIQEFLISGSFKRHTAIHPLHDIDLFFVFEPLANAALRREPLAALNTIRTVIGKAYPGKDYPILQSRSVNIEFSGTGLAFDLVPAFPDGPDRYIIPDRDANTWIPTNPRIHMAWSTEANERAGKMAKPLVKALKCWNCTHEPKVVGSFHLELMVYDLLREKPFSHARGIADLLQGMSERVRTPMPEPARIGPNVDARVSPAERERASRLFREGAELARQALALDAAGRVREAHGLWYRLLGPQYPERG